ncbi:hypothetical protein CHUAL_003678 [Chamberlinius hualienensis]
MSAGTRDIHSNNDYHHESQLLSEDWKLSIAYDQKRHMEKVTIDKTPAINDLWRLKDRMKTVSVALVMCLNVGVDPPDIVKTQPCAKLECWTDPFSMTPQKAVVDIGEKLQKQYEVWQPRARYKLSKDPTLEDVKKLCTSLRRNAKDERVLYHYNGHGVPRPTVNGEIWVFNKTFTQYIPLSIYDLQTWMGTPSIYIFDCSNAGIVIDLFRQFALQHEQEFEQLPQHAKNQILSQNNGVAPNFQECVLLAACGSDQILPMNPQLPADVFTSCLTTPIKIALKWYVLQNTSKLLPDITLDIIDRLPGQLNDRRTVMGELNWIFTAITDTIAWNTLPRDLFQRLFRQDLLVASIFRNFLLAERIMRSYNCIPCSSPKLPSTNQHPMWQAWDLALDTCLAQLPGILERNEIYQHSPFFAEQLTAFQVWLTFGSEYRNPPEQLAIVLQVLLSQVHRLRALDLLGRFLDLGSWAVNLALQVGIFPYVLKLLQSLARELRPLLVFIWAKILAVDNRCQPELVRENGHKYFLSVLEDIRMPSEHRMLAAFILSRIVDNYPPGQEAAMKGNVISICLEQLQDPNHHLRQWLAICLGKVWSDYINAREYGVRDTAHEKLYKLLTDVYPEVRAAGVFALGKFIGCICERSEHANTINHSIGITLITTVAQDGSPLVRKELIVALHYLVLQYESQFMAVASAEDECLKDHQLHTPHANMHNSGNWTNVGASGGATTPSAYRRTPSVTSEKLRANPNINVSNGSIESSGCNDGTTTANTRMRRTASSSAISVSAGPLPGTFSIGVPYASIYSKLWQGVLNLASDPHPDVSFLAKVVVNDIRSKVCSVCQKEMLDSRSSSSFSAPSSPSNRVSYLEGESPPANLELNKLSVHSGRPMSGHPRTKKILDKSHHTIHEEPNQEVVVKHPLIGTEFFDWCSVNVSQPVMKFNDEMDPESEAYIEREWRYSRNARVRSEAEEEQKRAAASRLENQIFINRNPNTPCFIRFHPYENYMAVADKDYCSIWNWEHGNKMGYFSNNNPQTARITSLDFLNAHDHTLTMLGSDDGVVKVWKYPIPDDSKEPELITSYHALSDMIHSSRGAGLILEWEQENCLLFATGDVKIIRIWDCDKELRVKDIPTGAESCVTSLSLSGHTFVTGFGDGSIRVYDRRSPTNDCRVATMREHGSWVVNVHMCRRGEFSGKIISGSVAGDVKLWDQRMNTSIKTYQTSQAMTAMVIHPAADIFACGSVSQFITVYSYHGENLSLIKYHDGFMGQRIGPVSCLAFHPHKVNLAAGSTDSIISVYAQEKRF